MANWYFYAVRANNAIGFTWHWQRRRRGTLLSSTAPFDYYYDCIADARKQGYRGAFPAGPKCVLKRVPGVRKAGSALTERLDIIIKEFQSAPERATSAHS